MKAETGRVYAQIVNGACHWKFTAAELPEWNNEQCPAVDVTGNEPAIGDPWDGAKFSVAPQETQDVAKPTRFEKLLGLLVTRGLVKQSEVDDL